MKKFIENQQFHVVDEKTSVGLSRVPVDGSWHRRGHSSLNGCLDCHVMSKHCSLFSLILNKKILSSEELLGQLKSSTGTSINTIVFIMNISEMVILLHIKKWLTQNLISIMYSIIPQKLECLGHVQKRLETKIIHRVFETNFSFHVK